ncbi:MAG: NACHT domain-containing protein [Streptosporangiaceae bacterium]
MHDLEPELFQEVVFTRLDRIRTEQATALDSAMAAVHADLTALVAFQEVVAGDRFAQMMGVLAQVLDKLPGSAGASQADAGQVAVYLAVLARWLNSDPWLDENGAGDISPASIERKLSIAAGDGKAVDADELARRCSRLVVLGGPGSGKTWLARRVARTGAQAALEALAGGRSLEEVELPLYITCARLAAAPQGDVIRTAVISSAVGALPDLGSVHLTNAIRALFEERQAPTLLVADSLDEARGADERVRLAGTLPTRWRIVLTSRPVAWRGQLQLCEADLGQLVGTLEPLRYPDDVEPVIGRWLGSKPAAAAELSAQLRARPALQLAATVPLILAFYCIVSGHQQLPALRRGLYDEVVRRMLAARWRGSNRDVDPDACMHTLGEWAWSAADDDPESGIGAWADEFDTLRAGHHSRDERDALNHVAVPLGRAHDVTGKTRRRFVHRTIREHLVATCIAGEMLAEEAAALLVRHLWYDPDWEIAGPAALAAHPERDQVLLRMLCLITGADQPPASLAEIDECREIRRFLSRVAQESDETDWPGLAGQVLRRALIDLAALEPRSISQVSAARWPTSASIILDILFAQLNTHAWNFTNLTGIIADVADAPEARKRSRRVLIGILTGGVGTWNAQALADAVIRMEPTPQERAACRQALIEVVERESHPVAAADVARAYARLAVTARELTAARRALLVLLADGDNPWKSAQLAIVLAAMRLTGTERALARRVLLDYLDASSEPVEDLARAIVRLKATPPERSKARQAVLTYTMARPADSGKPSDALAELTSTSRERKEARLTIIRLLTKDPGHYAKSAVFLPALAVTSRERTSSRRELLSVLPAIPEWASGKIAEVAADLASTDAERRETRAAFIRVLAASPERARTYAAPLSSLAKTPQERNRTRTALLRVTSVDNPAFLGVASLAAQLCPTPPELARLRRAVLAFLTSPESPRTVWAVAEVAAKLQLNTKECAIVRRGLLDYLDTREDEWGAAQIAQLVREFRPSQRDRKRAREALLRILEARNPDWSWSLGSASLVALIVKQVEELEPTVSDKARMRRRLLDLVEETSESRVGATSEALVEVVSRLDPTAADRNRGAQLLITILRHRYWKPENVSSALSQIALTSSERASARDDVLELLDRNDDWTPEILKMYTRLAVRLAPTSGERAALARDLVTRLAHENRSAKSRAYAGAVTSLIISKHDRAKLRQELLGLLAQQHNPHIAMVLWEAVCRLDPTYRDKARARVRMLALIAENHDPGVRYNLSDTAAETDPTSADLIPIAGLDLAHMTALMQAARRNSTSDEWINFVAPLTIASR